MQQSLLHTLLAMCQCLEPAELPLSNLSSTSPQQAALLLRDQQGPVVPEVLEQPMTWLGMFERQVVRCVLHNTTHRLDPGIFCGGTGCISGAVLSGMLHGPN